MMPPIFPIASASPVLKALIGTNPVRLWPFDRVPEQGRPGTGLPFVVHQMLFSNPDNQLAGRALGSSSTIQFDVYGKTAGQASDVSAALQHAIELDAHITSVVGPSRDPVTGLFRVILTVDWLTSR